MNETMPPPAFSPLLSHHVAVIGAGSAGLVAARELVREGHSVVVYEKGDQVGGTWVYTPQVESDLLGVDPNRVTVHSSLYKSLRINFPRELMGFLDFPFVSKNDHSHDPRRFAGHEEVLLYLQNFAREFCINEKVRLRTEVVNVSLLQNKKWKVRSRKRDGDGDGNGVTFTEIEDIFDAVVVCNGHYSEPHVAEIPGISLWPGKQMHSHNYRVPSPFQEQVVILIGNRASAFDIKRELSHVANEVHIADRSVADETYQKQPGYDNMWLHSTIERANQDGTVVFRNGKVISADVILHCTGYKYHFPFLKDVINSGVVTVDESYVGPLYKHVFPPVLSPWLSFVGIPQKVIPFPLFEFQSKWIAGVLSRRILLPSENEMMEDIKAFYSKLEASGKPKRHIHHMSECFYEYMDWLTELCSSPGLEKWRKEMEYATMKNIVARPGRYRDEWDDDDLVAQAQKDFIKCTQLTVPMSTFFSHTLCR